MCGTKQARETGDCRGCAEKGRTVGTADRCERCGEWACWKCERDDGVTYGCAWCINRDEYNKCEDPEHEDDYGGSCCTTYVAPAAWRGEMPEKVRLCHNCSWSCALCCKNRCVKACRSCGQSVCIKCVGTETRGTRSAPAAVVCVECVRK